MKFLMSLALLVVTAGVFSAVNADSAALSRLKAEEKQAQAAIDENIAKLASVRKEIVQQQAADYNSKRSAQQEQIKTAPAA